MEQADIFCLPSFSDPCPLVINEALCAGLPLLISDHCGNHYESVKNGINGIVFNPFDKLEIRTALEYMIKDHNNLKKMGRESKIIYHSKMSSDIIIRNLINDIKSITEIY
jgi:glycosyltransferase involved in cell wall biosynthesis